MTDDSKSPAKVGVNNQATGRADPTGTGGRTS